MLNYYFIDYTYIALILFDGIHISLREYCKLSEQNKRVI